MQTDKRVYCSTRGIVIGADLLVRLHVECGQAAILGNAEVVDADSPDGAFSLERRPTPACVRRSE